MLDIKVIRNDPELVATSIESKGEKVDLNSVIDLDKKRRTILEEVETLRSVRNKVSDEISSAKKEGKNGDDRISEMRNVSSKIKELDQPLKELEAELRELMLIFPNMPHKSVPVGKDASDNKLVRDWGKKLESDFELKDHLELGESLGLFDFTRSSKISGSGFPLYTGMGAKLERALINFMLDLQTVENGYKEIFPPFLVNYESALTTGQLPKYQDDMYVSSRDWAQNHGPFMLVSTTRS